MTGPNPMPVQNDVDVALALAKCRHAARCPRSRAQRERGVDERRADARATTRRQHRGRRDVRRPVGHVERRSLAGADAEDAHVVAAESGDEHGVVVARQLVGELFPHLVVRLGPAVGAEDRAAGVEHRLLVDEHVDDVELVRCGDADLDGARRPGAPGSLARGLARLTHGRRSRTATTLARPKPRATHAASTAGSPIGTWTTWSVTPRSSAAAASCGEERGVRRCRRDVGGDGVAVHEVQRRAFRRVASHRAGRIRLRVDGGEEAEQAAGPVAGHDAVGHRQRPRHERRRQGRRPRRPLAGARTGRARAVCLAATRVPASSASSAIIGTDHPPRFARDVESPRTCRRNVGPCRVPRSTTSTGR